MFYTPTLNDVCQLLETLNLIPRPYGDNEGYAINSDTVFYSLTQEHQAFVNQLLEALYKYTRLPGGQEPNVRSINHLTRHGYRAYLGTDQYDPYRLVGTVDTENWCVDISDAPSQGAEGDDY